ncbi:hypothetical protein HXX76_003660 [Chlamydomonas incerta]|uniref:PsbP C-terminal domain-containing protein n=1 Tax=Chlamydomonas incerta TaxID=51695 RepID=A0A835TL13_CHLIN|nr:hypothetical protein HXX76_003660 [Chlamydomonas incerta]|eukprot:KAG2440805.1 hypothetical protein HXX76_003660 [Chlamydomonas incerta]
MLQQTSRTAAPRSGAFGTGPAPRVSRCRLAAQCRSTSSGQQQTADEVALSRRQALASSLAMVAGAVLMPVAPAFAEAPAVTAAPAGGIGAGALQSLTDPILAYTYQYPIVTSAGKPLNMIVSRTPEKYSSAAPLTADARQRIVSEVFDFKNFVTASMTVGPASGVLKDRNPAEWKPREVALTVLVDRSTARTTAGQRVALNDVQESHLEARDGQQYWVYEHVSQGSPTITSRTKESYRHALAITSWRNGQDGSPYLYTLNLSCPEQLWPELEPVFKAAVAGFALLPTTRDYIPPDKDPWLFF